MVFDVSIAPGINPIDMLQVVVSGSDSGSTYSVPLIETFINTSIGDKRTVTEFDLSPFAGQSISSATLSWDETIDPGSTAGELHGYAGDGVLEFADAGVSNLLANSFLDGIEETVAIDVTTFIQGLLAGSETFAGFMWRRLPGAGSEFLYEGVIARLAVELTVPDPALSTVAPWDTYGHAFVSPGSQQSGVDLVTVTVRDTGGAPIPDASVAIAFSLGCDDLCGDSDGLGLTGITDASGVATFDPSVGGCDACSVTVTADGVVLATYTQVVSTDWDGFAADGVVNQNDLDYFALALAGPYDVCADYDGSGNVDISDLAILSAAQNDTNQGFCVAPTDVDVAIEAPPSGFALFPNHPNPFQDATSIGFAIPRTEQVSLRIHDVTGRLVQVLADSPRAAGRYTVQWNGRNDSGERVASGVYFYRLQAGEFHETRRMVRLK